MDSEDVVFVSLSISRLLFFFSGVVFFITGYLIPVTMETAGLTLRDFVLRDTIQRLLYISFPSVILLYFLFDQTIGNLIKLIYYFFQNQNNSQ